MYGSARRTRIKPRQTRNASEGSSRPEPDGTRAIGNSQELHHQSKDNLAKIAKVDVQSINEWLSNAKRPGRGLFHLELSLLVKMTKAVVAAAERELKESIDDVQSHDYFSTLAPLGLAANIALFVRLDQQNVFTMAWFSAGSSEWLGREPHPTGLHK